MKRTLATVFLCLMLATPAGAGFDEGLAAWNRGDYTTALKEWRPLTGTNSERLEAALRSASPALAGKTPPTPRPLKKFSTGSGFFVSPAGHVLTNEHVVAKCREVRVVGAKNVRQIANGGKIDLALLKVAPVERRAAMFRGGGGASAPGTMSSSPATRCMASCPLN